MKIRVNYTEYKFSKRASMWSRIGGTIAGYFFLFMVLFMLLIHNILERIWPDQNLFIVTIILSFALPICLAIFCSWMEKKCVERDMPQHMKASNLTDEQKRELIARIISGQKP